MGELDELIGRTVSGRYRVHALIGQGGMGKVFEAQQIPLGRAVALKVMGANQHGEAEEEFQQRFFHEAAILARLKSPHTVTVFDFGRDDDIFFIAMELLKGQTLDQIIAEAGVLAPGHSVAVAMQICRSLREAHAQGVIHRDLKPANVIVTKTVDGDEHVKVLDFGLAKRMTVQSDDTNPNVVPGSPKYMSPETIRHDTLDGRTDIYALGVMLYKMLTGTVPFDAESPMDVLLAHLQQAPEPLTSRNPGLQLPASLDALVMRCMAKSPDARYPDMQALIEALRGVAAEVGMRTEPTLGQISTRPPASAEALSLGQTPSLTLGGLDGAGPPGQIRPGEPTPSGTRVRGAGPSGHAGQGGQGGKAQTRGYGLWIGLGLLTVVAAAAAAFVMKPAQDAADARPPVPPDPGALVEPGAGVVDGLDDEAGDEQADEGPDMVISEADTARAAAAADDANLPSVSVVARSIPDGAAVIIRGKRMGLTPVTFDYRHALARRGQSLTVRFRKSGYELATVRQRIDGDELVVDAVLEEIALPGAELSAEEALRAVEARARRREEGTGTQQVPTLQIKPSSSAPGGSAGPVLQISPKSESAPADDGDDQPDDQPDEEADYGEVDEEGEEDVE